MSAPHSSVASFVTLGDRRLAMCTSGSANAPVVILEKGAAGGGTWGRVIEDLADVAQVITYDRAGTGASDPPVLPPTADQICEDLHDLIENAGITRPVVLVVWSLTGLSGLLHAIRYPGDLRGIVFIDPTPFDHYEGPAKGRPMPYPRLIIVIQKLLAALGYGRLWGKQAMVEWLIKNSGPRVDRAEATEYAQSLFDLVQNKGVGELWYMVQSCRITSAAVKTAAPLAVPAIILSATVDKAVSDIAAERKHQNHRAYAALFKEGHYVRVTEGSHMMTLDRPDIIADAVMHFIDGRAIPTGAVPAGNPA